MAAGISIMQVRVDQVIPSRAVAVCKEISTSKSIEVRLLPMRAGRVPAVGEGWIVDRTYGGWTFAALLSSPTLFDSARAPVHFGEEPPPGDASTWVVGQRWVNAPVSRWDGEEWVPVTP